MTASYQTYATFAFICLTLLVLPFIPAFAEWLRPTDTAPLPISPNYASDIDYFAKRFRADVAAKQGTGAPTGYEDFAYVTNQTSEENWQHATQRLISTQSIASNWPIKTIQPLYVEGDFLTPNGSSFNALYAGGSINLGQHSKVLDWAHAERSMFLGTGCVALRRLSAGDTIELGVEAWFERMYAPTIVFGPKGFQHASSTDVPVDNTPQVVGHLQDIPNVIAQTPSVFLVRGDCALPADTHFSGSLIVTGFLTVGARTTVQGNIKARGGVRIGPGAQIEGAITCEKRIDLWHGVRVWGPVVSERQIIVGSQAVVGLLHAPTTLSANIIIMTSGSKAHGAVWAGELGMVKSA